MWIGLAGFAGAMARYQVEGLVSQATKGAFPWGTLLVNLSGCFLLGLVATLLTERFLPHPALRSGLTIGFLGAYTTFSTFAYETLRMGEGGAWGLAFMNVVLSVAVGLLAWGRLVSKGDGDVATLYLVRHGRTGLNAAGVLRGHLGEPLDQVGRAEAERLADLFASQELAVVVTSPLARAWETALPIAEATGTPIEVEKDMIDRDYGPWAGRTVGEVEALHRSLDTAPEIEPLAIFVERVTAALDRLAARLGAVSGVVVAHEAVNRVALATLVPDLAGQRHWLPQETGCWNQLECGPTGWRAPVVGALPGDGRWP